MKTLKFRPNLARLILTREKTSTWRLFDDKELQSGDQVMFLNWETKQPFAKALLYDVFEKKLMDLNEEDRDGHEAYASMQDLLATLSVYYKTEVTMETHVKVIKFTLIETS
jgi:hypothetical protein